MGLNPPTWCSSGDCLGSWEIHVIHYVHVNVNMRIALLLHVFPGVHVHIVNSNDVCMVHELEI